MFEVQASGGINNNYIYNWDRNGTAIGGNGNQLTVDPPVSGIYNVEVSLDISALDPPLVILKMILFVQIVIHLRL